MRVISRPQSLGTRARNTARRPGARNFSTTLRRAQYADTIPNLRLTSDTRVIFQGFTGRMASINAVESIAWGTNIVGGVKPNFEGEHLGLPVVSSLRKAMQTLKPHATGIYVAAHQAAGAIEEAIEAEVPLIVAVAEHIPLHDILRIHDMLATQSKCRLVGANSPGIISATAKCRIGFQPLASYMPGPVSVAAKSGTLSYEAVTSLTRSGIGQSLCVGVGGDPISGTDFVDSLKVFEADTDTQAIALIGEIGGTGEMEAASWIEEYRRRVPNPKPVAALVAGACARPGKVMGHAGAWRAPGEPTVQEKRHALQKAGAIMVEHPAQFGEVMKSMIPRSPPSTSQKRGYHTAHRPRVTNRIQQMRALHFNREQSVTLLRDYGISASVQAPSQSHLLMITIARSARAPCIAVVPNGDPTRALQVPFAFSTGPKPLEVSAAHSHLGLPASLLPDFATVIQSLWSIYIDKEAVSLSIWIQADRGIFSIYSPDFTFDDAAFRSSKRQSELHALRDPSLLDPSELAGEPHGLVYIPLETIPGIPAVGALVNGAGLAMSTIDSLTARGLQCTNFLDTGGKATAATVKASLELILKDERVKVVFVNIFGGLTKCDMIAEGVLMAMEELEPAVPIVLRLRGTREEEAAEFVNKSSMKVFSYNGFEDAVNKVKEIVGMDKKTAG